VLQGVSTRVNLIDDKLGEKIVVRREGGREGGREGRRT